jgi:hypothetical protein
MSEVKTIEQIEAEILKLSAEKMELLKASKDADFETVKKLCKQHGFTATSLRSVLGKKKAVKVKATPATKSKAPAKKTATKKS